MKVFPKPKAQILKLRNQNVPEDSNFTVEKKRSENFNLSSCFHQSKIVISFIFSKHKLNSLFYILNHRHFNKNKGLRLKSIIIANT